MSAGTKFWLRVFLLAIVALLIYRFCYVYTEFLWFRSLGYHSVLVKILLTRFVLFVVAAGVAFAVLYFNLTRARGRQTGAEYYVGQSALAYIDRDAVEAYVGHLILGACVLLSLLFGLFAQRWWRVWLQFVHATPFGIKDELFGKDVAFYVFRLPVLNWLLSNLSTLLLLTLILAALVYLYEERIFITSAGLRVTPKPLKHLSILGALILVLKGAGYFLARYALTLRDNEFIYGAAYSDVHGRLPILWSMVLLCLGLAVLLLLRMNTGPEVRLQGWAIVGVFAYSILASAIYPRVLDVLVVRGNELARQRPYIERNIRATRQAFDIENFDEEDFAASQDLTAEDIAKNRTTIDSIRLWDHRPLRDTYMQEQQIQPYYEFTDVDVDRYVIGGQIRQVLLAPRELNIAGLPEGRRWYNRHLIYTHGYGLAMSPVNDYTAEGRPIYYFSGVPPVSALPELKLTVPQIYFGEFRSRRQPGEVEPAPGEQRRSPFVRRPSPVSVPEYVIVGANGEKEFDYPKGTENVFCTYDEEAKKKHVAMGGRLRRLAFAIRYRDIQLLISAKIAPTSAILMHRIITERARTLAPFLAFDHDPYLVVRDDGRLAWIHDAYTLTSRYPYASFVPAQIFTGVSMGQPLINYVRNSVKVVTDAYTGEVNFYIVEPDDPIVQTLRKIFPALFKSAEEMPEDIRRHLRYPVDLFRAQASILQRYHMERPEVFYGQTDQWAQPTERYTVVETTVQDETGQTRTEAKQEVPMLPYYVVIRLPGKKEPEFVLMLPFTYYRRMNIVAWLGAWWDQNEGARAVVYMFPRKKTVYGPMQVESFIDQDSAMSQWLMLRSKASRVIRGNLLVVPIEDSLLYVEPIYLQSEVQRAQIPQLKQVIVSNGKRVVMRRKLDEAVLALLDPNAPSVLPEELAQAGAVEHPTALPTPPPATPTPTPTLAPTPTPTPEATPAPLPEGVEQLLTHVEQQLQRAENAQRETQRELNELRRAVRKLRETLARED